MKFPLALLGCFLALHAAHTAALKPASNAQNPAVSPRAARVPDAVVRVNSTVQSYDFARPWEKKSPMLRRGTGAVLEGGRVLVTAELVANKTHLEIEKPRTSDKSPAKIVAVDYDANLALIEPERPGFLEGLDHFSLAENAAVGDSAEILQLEANGEIARTPATVTTITVAPYPLDSVALLLFRLSAPLQSRDSSFVLPALRGGRLLGLLMRYDARTQTAELIPAPVISRFLASAALSPNGGVPRLGVSIASTQDPQFRKFLGLSEPGGIYITEVYPDSPAARAGLRKGDVITAIEGIPIDQDGLYEDPHFGKIAFSYLLTSRSPAPETPPLTLTYLRDGHRTDIKIQPEPLDRKKMVSEPNVFDQAPRYVVLGGLVFEELSRTFLREWGANWKKTAPQRLVYLDAFQNELPPDHGKVVFLASILPSPETLGYEGLENLVVTNVNGLPIKSLDDLAQAIKTPHNGFHRIEFEEDPGFIILDAHSIEQSAGALARDYEIPALQNL